MMEFLNFGAGYKYPQLAETKTPTHPEFLWQVGL
jgi:hypothetical protein